jgi:ABC-type branched-subunit amino acid transport system ATPase component
MTTTQQKAVKVEGLRVGYEYGIEILRGIDLVAPAGEITAIIGPNGAGKSTLLRAIFGLAPVLAGRIDIGGIVTNGLTPRKLLENGIVYVPQERTIFPEMTVHENLLMGGWSSHRPRSWLADRIAAVLEDFPALAMGANRRAGDLSGGQQKALEIARGLIIEPSVLLLDEPTASLAPQPALQVYEEIVALSQGRGNTILLVDQNVREVLNISHTVYALAMGRNHTHGAASEVARRLDSIVADWLEQTASGIVGI